MSKSLLQHLRNIQVSQLVGSLGTDEDVGCLEITVQDLLFVEGLEASGDVKESLPDLTLFDPGPALEVGIDESHEISTLRELHDDAEIAGEIVVEGLLEFNNEFIVERGQNPDFVEGVFFLFLLHAGDADLLECVDLVVFLAADLVDLPEGPLADLLHDFEVLDVPLLALHL